jgi:copper homeostasis protein (lipoprotein)
LIFVLACNNQSEQKKDQKANTNSDEVQGLFIYWADAAIITDCLTGEKIPIAMEEDYISLEKAYLEKRKISGQQLLVKFKGRTASRPAMEGDKLIKVFIVEKFIQILPDTVCNP